MHCNTFHMLRSTVKIYTVMSGPLPWVLLGPFDPGSNLAGAANCRPQSSTVMLSVGGLVAGGAVGSWEQAVSDQGAGGAAVLGFYISRHTPSVSCCLMPTSNAPLPSPEDSSIDGAKGQHFFWDPGSPMPWTRLG